MPRRSPPINGFQPLTVRFADAQDCAAMAELSRETIEAGLPWRWREGSLVRMLESARHNLIVIDAPDDALAGFALMGYNDDDAYLALLAVAPAMQRRGIGSRLLAWLTRCAEVAGVAHIDVELRADNASGRALYERNGFALTRKVSGGYYGQVDQIRMRRVLRHIT
jgi:[ribosomal protein S18]-alanine N-acetyltransferase